jgi:hypothetical protein
MERMGFGIEKIKSDFARHKKKAAVLGVLSVVMVGFIVKAYFDLMPKEASASGGAGVIIENQASEVSGHDAELRLRQSRELWKTLREERGAAPAVAFTFDASYYPVDPKHPPIVEPDRADPVVQRGPVNSEEADKRARLNLVREQARVLIVRSTVVGSGNSKPVAVVNERILSTGDHIQGFEIVSIKAREVEFKKDGITLAVKMAEDTRGQ